MGASAERESKHPFGWQALVTSSTLDGHASMASTDRVLPVARSNSIAAVSPRDLVLLPHDRQRKGAIHYATTGMNIGRPCWT
jgi:hypothetical protein